MQVNQYKIGEQIKKPIEVTSIAKAEESLLADDNGSCNQNDVENDRFYPNAIYCLLAMYRNKYQQKLEGKYQLDDNVWSEISQEMKDSYFVFERNEIKEKFKQLRERYFSIETVQQLTDFDYFEAMHEIYQLPGSKQICSSPHVKGAYADEILFEESVANVPTKIEAVSIKTENSEQKFIEPIIEKSKDMTLHEFNMQQQLRHNEQMQLWQQMLRQQTCLIEQQKLLIEQLLKQI